MSKLQKVKGFAYKATVPAVLAAASVSAHAETTGVDISSLGTEVVKAVSQIVAIITSIGLAATSVVIGISAFRIAWSFVRGMK